MRKKSGMKGIALALSLSMLMDTVPVNAQENLTVEDSQLAITETVSESSQETDSSTEPPKKEAQESEQESEESNEEEIKESVSETEASFVSETEESLETETEETRVEETKEKKNLYQAGDRKCKDMKPIKLVADDLMKALYGDENGEIKTFALEKTFPTVYDPRVTAPELMTATKNQNPYGTCWSFGAMAEMETNLIKQGMADNTIDLSEMHLAYFAYHNGTDQLHNSDGDEMPQADDYLDYGGNLYLSSTTFMNWKGVETEEDFPYSLDTEDILTPEVGQNAKYHVNDIYYLPLENATKEEKEKALKEMITRYGAVTVAYYHDDSACWENEETISYNTGVTYSGLCNHEVVLVGWDDTYYLDQFEMEPDKDGAWIVKNSWGNEWGPDDGYFYVSYEDESFGAEAGVFVPTTTGEYDHNYYHSNLSCLADDTLISTQFAEVFTAKMDKEEIKAITFGISSQNASYTIDVYALEDAKTLDPTKGTKLLSQTGCTNLPGFYTVEFDKSVSVKKDTSIGIVIQFENPAELFFCDDRENHVNPGESFAFLDEGWEDLSIREGNLRINLLTNDVAEGENNAKAFVVRFQDEKGNEILSKRVRPGERVKPPVEQIGYEYSYDYNMDRPITENMTITVTKKLKEYQIRYHLNGASNSPKNPKTYHVESGVISLKPATKTGKEFAGWYWDEECWNPVTTIGSGTVGDIDLYACFYSGKNHLRIYPEKEIVGHYDWISMEAEADAIYYTTDGSKPTQNSTLYEEPFSISEDTTIKVITVIGNKVSPVVTKNYTYKRNFIVLDQDEVTLKMGESVPVNILEVPEDSENDEFVWYSDDDSIAGVANGKIYAVGAGETDIFCESDSLGTNVHVHVEPADCFQFTFHTENPEDTYDLEQDKKVSIISPAGSKVYYTMDGTEPTENSKLYQEPFAIYDDTTLKAIYVQDGKISDCIQQKYHLILKGIKLDPPTLQLKAGESRLVRMVAFPESCINQSDIMISYSEDVVEIEWVYLEDNQLEGFRITGLKAGEQTLWIGCPNEKMEYKFYRYPVSIEDTNELLMLPGAENDTQEYAMESYEKITIVGPQGASIYYTVDGTEPTANSARYKQALELKDSAVVKAMYIDANGKQSDTLTRKYKMIKHFPTLEETKFKCKIGDTVQVKVLEAPTDSLNPDGLWMWTENEDVVNVIEDKIIAVGPGKATVYAYVEDMNGMGYPVEVEVQVEHPTELLVFPEYEEGMESRVLSENEKVIMAAPEGATIYYTKDGTTPTTESMVYQYGFYINSDTIVKAIAIKDGISSEVIERDYKYVQYYPTLSDHLVQLTMGENETHQLEIDRLPDGLVEPLEISWVSESSCVQISKDGMITALSPNSEQESAWVYCEVKDAENTFRRKYVEILVYEEPIYHIYYDTDGGINDEKNPEMYVWRQGDFELSPATKEGFVFVGWETEDGKLIDTVDVDEKLDISLKAKWQALQEGFYIAEIGDVEFTGTTVSPEVFVFYGNQRLQKDVDYSVKYPVCKKVGKATVQVTGKGIYKGSIKKSFQVVPAGIEGAVFTDTVAAYQEKGVVPNPTVILNGVVLKKGRDYVLQDTSKREPGFKGTVKIEGKGNYQGIAKCRFKVLSKEDTNTQKKIAKAKITFKEASFVYSGDEVVPKYTVKYGEEELQECLDYQVFFPEDCTNVGTKTIMFVGKGSYAGVVKKTYEITRNAVLEDIIVSNVVYSKKGMEPEITVFANNRVLMQGKDYKVKLVNAKKVGTGKAIVTGIGNYKGSLQAEFTVEPCDVKNLYIYPQDLVISGKKYKADPIVMDVNGTILQKNVDYTVKIDDPKVYTEGTLIKGTIKAKSKNFKGEVPFEYHLVGKNKSVQSATIKCKRKLYADGNRMVVTEDDFEVKIGKQILSTDAYFVKEVQNSPVVGKVSYWIEGNPEAGYFGRKLVTVEIKKKDIK